MIIPRFDLARTSDAVASSYLWRASQYKYGVLYFARYGYLFFFFKILSQTNN
jgi:hypothetical protein